METSEPITEEQKFRELRKKYRKYPEEAYNFAYEALDFTIKNLTIRAGHVTARELLEGYRLYAIDQFGCLAKTVLNNMKIKETRDVGEIIYQLIEFELMRKTERDKREDFDNVYNFDEVFNIKPVFSCNPNKKEWKAKYVQRTKKSNN